jgi:N-acetyl-anhydromuramoyl-L-alanine amidase
LKRRVWQSGWWRHARRLPSPNFGPRAQGDGVSLAVVHSISLPPGHYGGDQVARLFTNRLDPDEHPYFDGLRGLRVSAHFFIRRDGQVLQFVSCDDRAWHAGTSCWAGREDCNDYSIGIELEGLETAAFECAQYISLSRLLRSAAQRYPLNAVVGHEHIAPGRKGDPGPGFRWRRLAHQLGQRPAVAPLALADHRWKPGAQR